MRTANLPTTFACPWCAHVHSLEDECGPRPSRESKRDRRRREARTEADRLSEGLRQMEGE
jgi:hypothetical protein